MKYLLQRCEGICRKNLVDFNFFCRITRIWISALLNDLSCFLAIFLSLVHPIYLILHI